MNASTRALQAFLGRHAREIHNRGLRGRLRGRRVVAQVDAVVHAEDFLARHTQALGHRVGEIVADGDDGIDRYPPRTRAVPRRGRDAAAADCRENNLRLAACRRPARAAPGAAVRPARPSTHSKESPRPAGSVRASIRPGRRVPRSAGPARLLQHRNRHRAELLRLRLHAPARRERQKSRTVKAALRPLRKAREEGAFSVRDKH